LLLIEKPKQTQQDQETEREKEWKSCCCLGSCCDFLFINRFTENGKKKWK